MVDQDRIKCLCNQGEMTFEQKLVLYPLMLKKGFKFSQGLLLVL